MPLHSESISEQEELSVCQPSCHFIVTSSLILNPIDHCYFSSSSAVKIFTAVSFVYCPPPPPPPKKKKKPNPKQQQNKQTTQKQLENILSQSVHSAQIFIHACKNIHMHKRIFIQLPQINLCPRTQHCPSVSQTHTDTHTHTDTRSHMHIHAHKRVRAPPVYTNVTLQLTVLNLEVQPIAVLFPHPPPPPPPKLSGGVTSLGSVFRCCS